MTEDEKAKAEELLKKRELAAKGLKERSDGKAVDPMDEDGLPDIDNDPDRPLTPEEKERQIADAAVVGLGLRRS